MRIESEREREREREREKKIACTRLSQGKLIPLIP